MEEKKKNKLKCSRCGSGNVYPRVRENTLVCRSCLNVEYITKNQENQGVKKESE